MSAPWVIISATPMRGLDPAAHGLADRWTVRARSGDRCLVAERLTAVEVERFDPDLWWRTGRVPPAPVIALPCPYCGEAPCPLNHVERATAAPSRPS